MLARFVRLALLAVGALALTSSLPAIAQQTAHCTLTVKIAGIRNTNGNILLIVRSNAGAVVQKQTAAIDEKTMTAQAVFTLPEGSYGVTAIHDENQNGDLDFDGNGMPVEGYGHSNNPSKRMGPPSFDETKFTLTPSGVTTQIQLIYWP